MMNQDPVKIPEIPGRISSMKKDGTEYIRYLAGRKYNADRKYNEPEWIVIGRRSETMPGLMYPNDNYEQLFGDESDESAMTAEETEFTRKKELYALYEPFFEALYYEFRQQTRRSPDSRVNEYKAESLNRVLEPLKEIMEGEDYAELLGLIGTGEDGMSYGDAMMLLTQYRSALAKFRRK